MRIAHVLLGLIQPLKFTHVTYVQKEAQTFLYMYFIYLASFAQDIQWVWWNHSGGSSSSCHSSKYDNILYSVVMTKCGLDNMVNL